MSRIETLNFCLWVLKNEQHIHAIFNDQSDKIRAQNFLEFAMYLYRKTNQYTAKDVKDNPIEIRVIASTGVVQGVFANVLGTMFDVDIVDLDTGDPQLDEKALLESRRIENKLHKIF